jgi:hypothetical protein
MAKEYGTEGFSEFVSEFSSLTEEFEADVAELSVDLFSPDPHTFVVFKLGGVNAFAFDCDCVNRADFYAGAAEGAFFVVLSLLVD